MAHSAYGFDSGPADGNWARHAACQHQPDLWFAQPFSNAASLARHICLDHCPVLAHCDRDAQAFRPKDGIQAGVAWTGQKTDQGGRPMQHQPNTADCTPRCWTVLGYARKAAA
jgi:hypothetical protein